MSALPPSFEYYRDQEEAICKLKTPEVFAPSTAPEPLPKPAADVVNEPPHYKQGKVECLDAIESAVVGLSPFSAVCVANVFKYIWRHRHKGRYVEDLSKAKFYLDKLIKHYEGVDK